MNKTIIIQASSRSNGDTNTIVNYIITNSNFDVIDLNTKTLVIMIMIIKMLMMILLILLLKLLRITTL